MAASELKTLIDTLKRMKIGNQFSPFIDYIVFPKYRQIIPNQRIHFHFPLTVLIGRNGTGKSSILHALTGAPMGKSVGRYWFGTSVDPIDEPYGSGSKVELDESQRARFWYGYLTKEGEERQAIKQRVRKEGDPDYWEPTRFAKKYGMTIPPPAGKNRHDQIQMASEYLSLRLYLSAFDKCFHFAAPQTLNAFQRSDHWQSFLEEAKQVKQNKGRERNNVRKTPNARDYIRHRSKGLEQAFASAKEHWIGNNRMAFAREELSPPLLAAVSNIVGKKYTAGCLIRHRFYESWGESIRFVTESGIYTEANAGSGETAVVMIARMFERAMPNSLLLLDEPETSLHPGAQAKLLQYILQQIKSKKLQVVISTHAPAFVRYLPKEAIKVLQPTSNGFITVIENVTAEDAFYEIGQEFDPNCNIIVEDKLAKVLLDEVAKTQGNSFAARVKIRFGPGGDSAMKQDAAVYIKDFAKSPILIFDGDKEHDHQDPAKLTQEQMSPESLDKLIIKQVGFKIVFAEDSKMPEDRKLSIRLDYIKYYHNKIFYLPFKTPEQVLWSDDAARAHLNATLNAAKVEPAMKSILAEHLHKNKFAKLADALGGIDYNIQFLHAMFVKRLIDHGDPVCVLLVDLLKRALAVAETNHV